MKRIKAPSSLIKTLIRNAEEARALALQFSQRVEQRAHAVVYRKIQKRVHAAAEKGLFEARIPLTALGVSRDSVPGLLAKLQHEGFEAGVASYEVKSRAKGAPVKAVEGLIVGFAKSSK